MNSRSKGNRGENKFTKEVMNPWTNKKWARVPSSGGLQWKAAHAKGDITCTEEGHYSPFCVEIKNYGEINFWHLLYDVKSDIADFWKQCLRDAKIANKAGLLGMRYNRLPGDMWFIVIEKDVFFKFFMPYLDEDEDKFITMRYHEFVIMNSYTLMKVPYKKIRKPLKQYIHSR